MTTSSLSGALQTEREVYLTTYTPEGKPGTVPVWFVTDDQRVYITTGPTPKKTQKLRLNPNIRLAFGSRSGPALEGRARLVGEPELWQRVAPLFVAKYQPYWKSPEAMSSGWERGASVLVEVTPARG
jgi:PPOX class probable F420-dependent enzyme